MTEPLLQAVQLSRVYGNYKALEETDFKLQPGELIILSGPNGSGKTTLLMCLSGLLRPTTGSVVVSGYDLYRDEALAHKSLAFVPDVPRFYTELTAWEHLRFQALAFGIEKDFDRQAEILLKEFNLWNARDLYPHHYSRGMRLKLGLAMAFIRPFSVLLLDEPTSALDEEGIELICSKLAFMQQRGAAILLSSHDSSLAAQLNGQVWRMQNGILDTKQ